MKNGLWTFETLARADRATLETVILQSKAPEPDHLTGFIYDGFNRDWLGQMTGAKFRKAFLKTEEQHSGLNQFIEQDNKDVTSVWHVKMENGKPVEKAFFNISSASQNHQPLRKYNHLLYFDYNIDPNPRSDRLMRSIRDYVGMPNEGNCDVLLGKAYLKITSSMYLFASYFILGRRTAYTQN